MRPSATLLALLTVALASGALASGARAQTPGDLVLAATVDPDDLVETPGGRVSINYAITNNSSTSWRNLTIGFYLSTDATFDLDGDTFLESETQNVRAGEREPEFEQISLPDQVASGEYFLLVVLDPRNFVTETNKANNVVATPITIGGDDPVT